MTSLNGHGLRFAFGTLTALPVGVSRWDRGTARAGMLCAPLAGLAVGLLAAVPGVLFLLGGSGPLVAAVASAALPAALTRGLHLDGLADTADGLGSAKPAGDALRIMKQSDIGPFGVITLLFVLLAQVAALFELYGRGWADGALGTVVAAVTARLALTLAARRGVPSARPEGLGAAVAGTVPRRGAAAAVCAVLACCAAAGALLGGYGAGLHQVLAVAAGLAAAQVMLRHCVRRFGGVTGDVFGALEETAGTVALLALSLSLG
ncbi:adenosylcobinamide-GDP ribazoletransferase [Streptomyces sp. NRRL S-4]|uniref:adenosylcobinamide-GDP ribazoletransferase n=1 Tax=Streptomyces sp. NRRL S-4 TaxID=1519471 RepID=UPI0006B5A362|nr:adenosylcobinamide-GDP ribazoletransferase [Streptomyces sp. NRRL S-4]KPC84492.1 CMP-binding protein [Streptomyces sp. NRRL S-4]